jgi:hypothetical protein
MTDRQTQSSSLWGLTANSAKRAVRLYFDPLRYFTEARYVERELQRQLEQERARTKELQRELEQERTRAEGIERELSKNLELMRTLEHSRSPEHEQKMALLRELAQKMQELARELAKPEPEGTRGEPEPEHFKLLSVEEFERTKAENVGMVMVGPEKYIELYKKVLKSKTEPERTQVQELELKLNQALTREQYLKRQLEQERARTKGAERELEHERARRLERNRGPELGR